MNNVFVYKISIFDYLFFYFNVLSLSEMATKITIGERVEILEIGVDRQHGRLVHTFKVFWSDLVPHHANMSV